MHLRKAAIHAIEKYNGNANSDKSCISIQNFLDKKQKGSASYRKILGLPSNGVTYKGMNIIRNFFH